MVESGNTSHTRREGCEIALRARVANVCTEAIHVDGGRKGEKGKKGEEGGLLVRWPCVGEEKEGANSDAPTSDK